MLLLQAERKSHNKLSITNKTRDEMKDSVYEQRIDRKNKGGRYPIEDRDMVHSLKCTVKLSPIEKDQLTV